MPNRIMAAIRGRKARAAAIKPQLAATDLGNGEAEIRPLAKYVTTPNGENPLSAAIDHFFPGLLEGI